MRRSTGFAEEGVSLHVHIWIVPNAIQDSVEACGVQLIAEQLCWSVVQASGMRGRDTEATEHLAIRQVSEAEALGHSGRGQSPRLDFRALHRAYPTEHLDKCGERF